MKHLHDLCSINVSLLQLFLFFFPFSWYPHRAFEVNFFMQDTWMNPGTLSPLSSLMRVSTSHRALQLIGPDKRRLAQLMWCQSMTPLLRNPWIYWTLYKLIQSICWTRAFSYYLGISSTDCQRQFNVFKAHVGWAIKKKRKKKTERSGLYMCSNSITCT